ncbi:MAG: metallophosphoesterase [Myxococcales bacterium]|nr:metallophosphoesterase [Myxococcales bacterium]
MHRIYAISDLHLGGMPHPMLGSPKLLADFLRYVARQARARGETRELVIHGDFVDFLAERSRTATSASPATCFDAWTPTQADALAKLEDVIRSFQDVFAALAECVQHLDQLTILLGNHDLELALPAVRTRFLRELGTSPHRCRFVVDNEAYRVGDVLIEHGNRYDPWNAIDYDGLRREVSTASRGETNPLPMAVCPGSRLVAEVVSPLKSRYHFIDLLKPEDKVVTLLLLAIEPTLQFDLDLLFRSAASYATQWRHAHSFTAARRMGVGAEHGIAGAADGTGVPGSLAAAFPEALVTYEEQPIASSVGWIRKFLDDRVESLRVLADKGEEIPEPRMRRLQVALRHALVGDRTFDLGESSGPYAAAAARLATQTGARLVIMGHTHLARAHPVGADGAWYVNTGTWADVIQCDPALLEDKNLADFSKWVVALARNELAGKRAPRPCYADVVLTDELRLAGPGALSAAAVLKPWKQE